MAASTNQGQITGFPIDKWSIGTDDTYFTGTGEVGSSLSLADSGVTAGSYTNVTLTVDAKGRVTSASNGTSANEFKKYADLATLTGAIATPSTNSVQFLDDDTGATNATGAASFVFYNGAAWESFAPTSTAAMYQTVANNGAEITYRVLSGTPVVTVDKTTPTSPTLNVVGGTIRLKEFRDQYTTSGSTNPTYTINATWATALSSYPSKVTKIITSSGQQDDDLTPQVIISGTSTTQVTVTINAVSSNNTFIFGWNNVE